MTAVKVITIMHISQITIYLAIHTMTDLFVYLFIFIFILDDI
jgi:hypothetical protein